MVITISREYGAAARGVAEELARLLGYTVVDEQLPTVVAERLGTSADVVEAGVEGRKTFGERVLGGLEAAAPEVQYVSPRRLADFDDALRAEVENAIREFADRGDCIIVGRIANMVLGRRPDVVRIFLHASLDWRIAHVRESLGTDRARALAEIERVDGARRHYARDRYDMSWGDARHYDLTLDVSTYGIERSAELIGAAVRAVQATM